MNDLISAFCSEWSSRVRLDDLLQRLTECLPGLPGFQTLSLFGSMAEGRADGYSDIDLIVTTDDLPAAKQHLLGVLQAIGAIEYCWVISLRPDEWNPTIIFTGEGYYHKLDIGLVAATAINRTIPVEQATPLVTRTGDLPHAMPCRSQTYMPPEGSVGHFLLGQFLGGIRYLKARKRGQPLTCYRFVSAVADRCLRAFYIHLAGGEFTWPAGSPRRNSPCLTVRIQPPVAAPSWARSTIPRPPAWIVRSWLPSARCSRSAGRSPLPARNHSTTPCCSVCWRSCNTSWG